jgi:hypothetical protein
MQVLTSVNPDGTPSKGYVADEGEHLVLTGPVQGLKTLSDGTQVNVTPDSVAVGSLEQAAELAHLISMHHVENGHPHGIDTAVDEETGETHLVQRPFDYVAPDGTEHAGKVGHRHGEHPVEKKNAKLQAKADAAAAKGA